MIPHLSSQVGEIFKISFFRDPSDPDDIDLAWEKVDTKPVEEPKPRYFLVADACARYLQFISRKHPSRDAIFFGQKMPGKRQSLSGASNRGGGFARGEISTIGVVHAQVAIINFASNPL